MKVFIKENAFVAKLAAGNLGTERVAMVIGKKIFLWNISAKDFLNDIVWLRHESAHVKQFKQYGFLKFIFLYLKESFKNGYEKNRFEIEATQMENEESILDGLDFFVDNKNISLATNYKPQTP
jgi:hypothetical protein